MGGECMSLVSSPGVRATASPPTQFPAQYSPALPWGTTRFGMESGWIHGALGHAHTRTGNKLICECRSVSSAPVRRRQETTILFAKNCPRPLVRLRSSHLHAVHVPPINPVIFRGSYLLTSEKVHLEGGFPLRCFQRLSRPNVATQLCRFPDNWHTSGSSSPVLSY
jgi:hypothetical protein